MKIELKVSANGTKFYYIKGTNIYHRLDGPAVEYTNGDKIWYKEGKYHRLDGPAIEWADGSKSWYKEGFTHRLDGPAVVDSDGYIEYWIEGKYIPNVNSIEEAIIKNLLE